jgi:type II secretory pathway component PulL
MKAFSCVIFILFFVSLTNIAVFAQEQEEEGNVYAISTWKIRFDQVDDFLEILEKESKPIYMQNEHVKSLKVLTHLWGEDWTVVMISEYESMAGIEAAQKKATELFEQKYPDEKKRKEVNDKRRKMIMGHTDNIVREVPNLRK